MGNCSAQPSKPHVVYKAPPPTVPKTPPPLPPSSFPGLSTAPSCVSDDGGMNVYVMGVGGESGCVQVGVMDTVGDLRVKVETALHAAEGTLEVLDGEYDDSTLLMNTWLSADCHITAGLTRKELAARWVESRGVSSTLSQKTGTHLHNAFKESDITMIDMLFTLHGVTPLSDIYNAEMGISPLMYAASVGDEKLIKQLVKCGSDAEAGGKQSPLCFAARMGHDEAIQTLLELGCRQEGEKGSSSPLMYAIKYGRLTTIELLLESASREAVNHCNLQGDSALVFCVQTGDATITRNLLEKSANPNQRNHHHVTPIMYAAQNGDPVTLLLLLQHGASPNTAKTGGWTPLMLAARNGHIEIVKILLDNGADPSPVTSNNQTAAMIAQCNAHDEVAAYLAGQ